MIQFWNMSRLEMKTWWNTLKLSKWHEKVFFFFWHWKAIPWIASSKSSDQKWFLDKNSRKRTLCEVQICLNKKCNFYINRQLWNYEGLNFFSEVGGWFFCVLKTLLHQGIMLKWCAIELFLTPTPLPPLKSDIIYLRSLI